MRLIADVPCRCRRTVIVIALALPLSGCGGEAKPPTYDVTGKVTFQGAPVKEGSVIFEEPSKGVAKQVPLAEGGAYEVELPAGSYRISVTPPLDEGRTRGDTPVEPDFRKVPDIPQKYWFSGTSGLTAKVGEEGTAHDFDMTR